MANSPVLASTCFLQHAVLCGRRICEGDRSLNTKISGLSLYKAKLCWSCFLKEKKKQKNTQNEEKP